MSDEPSATAAATLRAQLAADWFPEGQDPAVYDPVRSARAGLKMPLPKRFYTEVSTELRGIEHVLLLDGRPAKTRGRALLAVANAEIARILAAEWAAQLEFIDPSAMPVTRILHAAIDHVAGARAAVAADILNYVGSDLVCYRTAEPEALAALQIRHWDPVLKHIRDVYGARFILTQSVMFVAQPPQVFEALRTRIEDIPDPAALAALHVLTTISGSALIAITVADGVLDADGGYDAGEVDADYEASVWGADEEAAQRRINRLADFKAASAILAAIGR